MRRRVVCVFLDVDGVVLPFDVVEFPAALLAHLGLILDAADARAAALGATSALVVSSSWRASAEAMARLHAALAAALGGAGAPAGSLRARVAAAGRFEHTTDVGRHQCRQWEIGDWLRCAAGCRDAGPVDGVPSEGLDVVGWVALDDEELLDGRENGDWREFFKGHVVKTESRVGLVRADVPRAAAALARGAAVFPARRPAKKSGKRRRGP